VRTGRRAPGKPPTHDLQKAFFRAGHAHAGVLVVIKILTSSHGSRMINYLDFDVRPTLADLDLPVEHAAGITVVLEPDPVHHRVSRGRDCGLHCADSPASTIRHIRQNRHGVDRVRRGRRAVGYRTRVDRKGRVKMTTEREETVDRVIAFSDGVVAIALTLLILPLTEIEPGEGATLRNVAVDNSGALFAFALSFAVIANYWTIHKDIFRPLRRHNPRLVLLNMLWLAAIVFLPFPTSLIENGLDGGFGTLYISTLLVVSVLNLILANYLARHPELTDGQATADSRQHLVASLFTVGALVVALVISLFSPSAGVWALLLLFPAQIIAGRLPRRASTTTDAPAG